MRANGLVRDALSMLEQRGFVPVVGTRGKHFKIRWVDGNRTFTLIVSRSASDWRAQRQSRAVLQRLLRREMSA